MADFDFGSFGTVLSAVGSLLGGASSVFGGSGGTSVYKSAQLAKYQNKLQREYDQWYIDNITKPTANYYAKNQYSLQRQGLVKAGYNPMLGYMSSSNMPMTSAGTVQGASANEGNQAMAGVQGAQAMAGLAQVSSQIKNTNANTALQTQQAKTETFKQINISLDNELKRIQKQLEEGNLKYQEREKLLDLQRGYTEMKAQMINAMANQTSAGASVTNAKAAMKNAEVNEYGNPFKAGGTLLKKFANWQPKSNVSNSNRSYWDKMQNDSYNRR